MNVTRACLVGLVVTLGIGSARAQYSGPLSDPSTKPLTAPDGLGSSAVDGPVAPPVPRLSDYVLGTRAGCCGPLGADGPIDMEGYLRWGPSIVLNSGYFGQTLKTGWAVAIGGRSLFWDADGIAAWTVDAGISVTAHHGKNPQIKGIINNLVLNVENPFGGVTPIEFPEFEVSVSHLNRTFVNLGFGREWYLIGGKGPACCGGCGLDAFMWRVGYDIGGRWGTSKLEVHEIQHRSDVMGGVWLSLHSDVEIPCGCCTFILGGRVEWDYIWTDIINSPDADIQNLNLLMTLGVRY